MGSGNQVTNIATKTWKTEESRKTVIKSITDEIIKKGSPDVNLRFSDVVQSAKQFEANANVSAKTQDEYLNFVTQELERIRARTWKTVEVKKNITNPFVSAEIDANGDWQEQVYESFQFLKQRYYYAVESIYRKCCRELQVDDPSRELPRQIELKSQLENILSLFELSKSQITADMKDQARKAYEYIREVITDLNNQSKRQQSPDVQPKQQTTAVKQQTTAVKQQTIAVKQQTTAVKQQTNFALQEFGVNNNAPRISETEAFGTKTKTERILPLIKESNDQNQGFDNTEVQSHAIHKLIRALTSISPEALIAAVGEIEKVVHLNDEIPKMVDEQGLPIYITPGGWKMPRSFVATTDSPSMRKGFNQFTYTMESDLNSFATKEKRSLTVENQNLIAEIKEINNRLFDCEVVIAEKENAKNAVGIASDQSEGLVVKILCNAVTVNQNLVSHFTADKKSLIEPLRLLIPSSYPSCSLVILDELPLKVSDDLGALFERAKEKLRFNLGRMKEPLLIKDIARVWERCAREAILDYAHANGGETFTSMLGNWDVC